ncbi:hypothetical protein PVAP13_6NG254700 [Panicum virgatum]|uniref:CCHC-type domain-containing protein n=1 Tax=Panicum virgatum TaxID=38727 RepID=A0A8T0R4Y7_PANVG|nr:hypothetical protein PVAP13_6NG254700 [Panicum virgatum]
MASAPLATPLPDAPPPPSPTPSPTPGTAATKQHHHPSPASGDSPSSFASTPCLTRGRSKAQRWKDDVSPTAEEELYPTYKEVLLAGGASSTAVPDVLGQVISPAPTQAPPLIAPRIICAGKHPPRPAALVKDADGWVKAEGRRARRERHRRERPPRRPVPADLWGRCFNCLSHGHQASRCRSRPRCFSCKGLGHRSRGCPSRRPVLTSADPRPRGRFVWRPVVPVSAASGSASAPMDTSPASVPASAPAGEVGSRGRKRRRGPRRPRSAGDKTGPGGCGPADIGMPSPLPSMCDAGRDVPSGEHPPKPRRILDRTEAIRRREDELARALVVTIIGDLPVGVAELVRSSIAIRFEVEEELLRIHRWGPASFLLTLPSDELVDRIYNGGRPLITASVHLHFMRWTRFLNSTASNLPSAIEVEVRGIPAHAWELSTAELLLDEWCWIDGLHPSVTERRDVVRLKAWRSCHGNIPAEMELEIVEPPLAGSELGVRTLTYPISVSVTPFEDSREDSPPPSSLPGNGRRRRRQQGRRSAEGSPAQVGPRAVALSSSVPGGRPPVHARLGSRGGQADEVG